MDMYSKLKELEKRLETLEAAVFAPVVVATPVLTPREPDDTPPIVPIAPKRGRKPAA